MKWKTVRTRTASQMLLETSMQTRAIRFIASAVVSSVLCLNALLSSPPCAQAQTGSDKKPTTTGAKVKAWEVRQWSRVYGDMLGLVSDRGFKMTYLKSGMNIIALPPFTDYSIFSRRTKKIATAKIATFRSLIKPIGFLGGINMMDVPLVKKSTKVVASMKADWYESPQSYSDSQIRIRARGDISGSAVRKMELASASSLGVAPSICTAMAKVTEVPLTKGIPLECTYYDMDMDVRHHLKTFSCKTVQVPASEFEIPKDLKIERQIEQVNVGEGDQDALDLMLESGRRRVEKGPKTK